MSQPVLSHMRQSWETMTSVSAGHIILTPLSRAPLFDSGTKIGKQSIWQLLSILSFLFEYLKKTDKDFAYPFVLGKVFVN